MKILIVEDTQFNLDLLIQLLEDDFELISARDGQAGIEAARSESPDLILMDMSLPVVDGWEATRVIKSDPDLSDIPIIALTAHAMHGDEVKARNSGCDGYVTKPIDEDTLFRTIEELIRP